MISAAAADWQAAGSRSRLRPKRCGTDGGGLRHRRREKKRKGGGRLIKAKARVHHLTACRSTDVSPFLPSALLHKKRTIVDDVDVKAG